jgi:hypothetical protein
MTDWPQVHENVYAQLQTDIGGADHHNSMRFTRIMALLGCPRIWCATSQDCFFIKSYVAAVAALAQYNVRICGQSDAWYTKYQETGQVNKHLSYASWLLAAAMLTC